MRRVGGVPRAGILTPHGLDQQPPPPNTPPPSAHRPHHHLTLSDRPEAVKQGFLEDPLQALRRAEV